MHRNHHPISLQLAMSHAPGLARLAELTQGSSGRLRAIEPLIPAMLRPAVQAGPLDGDVWCLLVNSNAAAAKIRQLLPAFAAHLRSKGWACSTIRIKVYVAPRR